MKKEYKLLLRTGVLGVIIVLMICTLNTFFQPTWLLVNNYYTTAGFYEEPKNRIETLFLGSSVGAYGFSPMELYRDYGVCSYSVSTDAQPVLASYYWLEETYRLHKKTLKNVVLDVSELRKDADDSSMHKALDGMKLSSVKIKAAIDYADGDFEKALSYILPLTLYHSRWKELESVDFEKYGFEKVNGTRGFAFTLMTYMSTVSSVDELKILTTALDEYAEPEQLSSQALEYFYKMHSFCKEKGITLTLVKTPTDNWNSGYNRAVQSLADECGLTYLDFNFSPLTDDIGYIHPYDSRESKHLNYFGVKKLMQYLGGYLADNCTFTDVRDNEDFAYMEEQYEIYKTNCIQKYDLSQAVTVSELIDTALRGNNTLFIAVKDEASVNFTQEQRDYCSEKGLEKLSGIGFRNSYIGVINADGVIYEATDTDNKKLTYETELSDKTAVLLESGKTDGKDKASCIINGDEESINARGINIVIYSNEIGEVIYTASFDTYAFEEREVYLSDFYKIVNDENAAEKYEANKIYGNIVSYKDKTDVTNAAAIDTYIKANNDIFGFLNAYFESENTQIFLSVKDEAATKLQEEDRAAFEKYGLKELSELSVRESYLAVIENGKIVYEERSAEEKPISFEKDNFSLISAGFSAGNISSVTINGEEFSPNVRGINIVVYDKNTDSVIKTAVFDTYSKPIKSSSK